jgi:hypothetical protein
MIPGEIVAAPGELELNKGRNPITIEVASALAAEPGHDALSGDGDELHQLGDTGFEAHGTP